MAQRLRIVGLGLALALASVACGGGANDADTTPAQGATQAPASAGDAASQKRLAFAESSLGKILTVEDGNTVYVFMKDESGESSCLDACAQTWPPLEVGDGVGAGTDVDAEKIGSLARPGGAEQVSYDGRPLYHYSGDTKPGDTKGQGVGGNWFVIGADGGPIRP